LVLAAFLLVPICCLIALAVDVGFLCTARTELQRAADASALAAAWNMMDQSRLTGGFAAERVILDSRREAADYAGKNTSGKLSINIDLNTDNSPHGDVVFGRHLGGGHLTTLGNVRRYNAVRVRTQRSDGRNGELPLFFARVMGMDSVEVAAEATAALQDDVMGFRPSDNSGNSSLIPFTLSVDSWRDLLMGHGADEWTYDPATEEVVPGPDGVPELKFYPIAPEGSSSGDGISGNFGTLEIGLDTSNGTGDLRTQIRDGISQQDLDAYGGELVLDPVTETLPLSGDPGVSAGIKHALADVIGQPRTMPIYQDASGSGDNAVYTIVGFAGIRILDFWLDGETPAEEMDHYIILQPAYVIDDSAVNGNAGQSHFVYQPPVLVD
jgi:hypothetical protein